MNKLNVAAIAALYLGMAALCSAQTSKPASTSSGAKSPAVSSSSASASTSPSTATSGTAATAPTGAPYTEGPVWDVTMVKTKTGMEDDYLKQLSQALKPIYEEEKKLKVILDYKILLGDASSPHDYNILIMVQYPNMAAFDGLREKTEPIMAKIMGGEDQQRQLVVKRLEVREILGTKTMREITLK